MMFFFKKVVTIGTVMLIMLFFTFPALAQDYTLRVSHESLNFGEVELGKEKTLELNVIVDNYTGNPVDMIVNLTPGLGFCVDKAIWTVPANVSNYSITLKVVFKPVDTETYSVPLAVAIVDTVGLPGSIPAAINVTKAVVTLTGKGK